MKKSLFSNFSERLRRFKLSRGDKVPDPIVDNLNDELSEGLSESYCSLESPSSPYTMYSEFDDEYSIEEPDWQTEPGTNPHVLCWMSKDFKVHQGAGMEYIGFKLAMDEKDMDNIPFDVCFTIFHLFASFLDRNEHFMSQFSSIYFPLTLSIFRALYILFDILHLSFVFYI